MPFSLQLIALEQFPDCLPGDDLAAQIVAVLANQTLSLRNSDVLVVAQKVVSKVEGRYVTLDTIKPSSNALALAASSHKDPRLVELILRESAEVVRVRPSVIVVEHRNGYVHANAGIDHSNIPQPDGRQQVLLLPKDPDRSARQLRARIGQATGTAPGVIVSDSVGRAWRNGTTGMALGSAGIQALESHNGKVDMYGHSLQATEVAVADQMASAAALVMGEAAERIPVVLLRGSRDTGAAPTDDDIGCHALIREKCQDMFR